MIVTGGQWVGAAKVERRRKQHVSAGRHLCVQGRWHTAFGGHFDCWSGIKQQAGYFTTTCSLHVFSALPFGMPGPDH